MKNKKVYVTDINKVTFAEDDFNGKIEKSTEVIVKTRYTHISAGTELACIDGLESFFTIPGTPGYTSVGEIVEKGSDVTHFEIGDLVYTYGPHALYFKIDVTDRWHGVCVKLPAGINPEHATFTHMAGIAMTSLRVSNIELGDHVAVIGLGAIGNLAAQLAGLQGANVTGIDVDETRIEVAAKCGIPVTLNGKKVNVYDEVMKITGDKGVFTLIDASGSAPVIAGSLDFVGLNGEVILLGSPRAPYETNITEVFRHFHLLPWNHTMKGALEFTIPTHQQDFSKHSIERNAGIIMNLIKEDKLKIAPIYTHKLTPENPQKAYDGLRNQKDEYIGVVFDWTSY